MREVIATDNGPKAIGPYSQAIKANGFIFLSGQTPLDPATQQLVAGGIAEQTERTLEESGGHSPGRRFQPRQGRALQCVSEGHERLCGHERGLWQVLQGNPPARTTVQAARLPKDCLVEIDAIALA